MRRCRNGRWGSMRAVLGTVIVALLGAVLPSAAVEMETTRYGQGQESNFFGLRSSERAYNDCIHAPGTVPR